MVGRTRAAGSLPGNVVRLGAGHVAPRRRTALDKPALLKHVAPFDRLEAAALGQLAQQAREIELPRGATLFQKGEVGHGLFAVVFGQVKLAFPATNGNEKILNVLGPRNVLGECAVFHDGSCQFFAETLLDTLVLFIPREPVLAALDVHPAFARGMFDLLTQRARMLVREVESLSLKTSTQRVIDYLIELSPGGEGFGGTVSLTLPTSKQVLAARLNLTPETLSRIFGELVRDGLIKVDGRQIVVCDLARLFECAPDPARLRDATVRPVAGRAVS